MKFHFASIVCCFLLISSITKAQKSAVVYDNQRIKRPTEIMDVTADDLKLNDYYKSNSTSNQIFWNRQSLIRLGDYFQQNENGKQLWTNKIKETVAILNQWDFKRGGMGAKRYIYAVEQLDELALIYYFTQNKVLGRFIQQHVLQIAKLPIDFWLHAELRGYDKEKPLGMIETASLCNTIAASLHLMEGLLSIEEKKQVSDSLRWKGLQPCLNWLDKPGKNNFTAVISAGAFVASKFLNDTVGRDNAQKIMVGYLDNSLESDGSYGEGPGYFNYPISSLLPAVLCMTETEREKIFSKSGLRNSAIWKVYPYFFFTDVKGNLQPNLIHFGDNSYSDGTFLSPPKQTVNVLLASLYQDGLAVWLMNKFNSKLDLKELLLLFSNTKDLPKAISPEALKLPTINSFNNGDCFIRSTWQNNGIVLGLRTGNGSRVEFSHQRPELNSIGMGAYGEYFIVSPGAASYRSPLYYLWDRNTRSANTISIDDCNQLFPGNGNYHFIKIDNAAFWKEGTPKAEITLSNSSKIADVLVNEAAKAYPTKMNHAQRAIIFVKDPGYFVMIDKLEAADSSHKYTWRIHLNNRDEKGVMKKQSNHHWQFNRPLANLNVYLFSNQSMSVDTASGYMHGVTRDYSPGGVNEGKLGTSIELAASNTSKSKAMMYFAVLFPYKFSQTVPEVYFKDGILSVGKDTFKINNNQCEIKQKGITQLVGFNF